MQAFFGLFREKYRGDQVLYHSMRFVFLYFILWNLFCIMEFPAKQKSSISLVFS